MTAVARFIEGRPGSALRWLVLVLLLAVPALAGAGMAYAVMILSLLLAIALIFTRPTLFGLETAGTLLLVAYAGIVVMTVITSLVSGRSAELNSVFNFIALPLFVPLLAVMSAGLRRQPAMIVSVLALIGVAITAGLGIYETSIAGLGRAGYVTSDPIRYAATALLLGFLALGGVVGTSARWRWVFLVGPVLAAVALYVSGSRGPLAAVPVLVLVAIVMLVPRRRRLVVLGLGVVLVAVVIAAGYLSGSRMASMVDIVLRALRGEATLDESFAIRLNIYRAGLTSFLDASWLGHGWSQITLAPQPYFSDPLPLHAYSHLHNDILDFAVAFGVPGIVLYVMIVAAPIAGALRSARDSLWPLRVYGCVVLSVGYLIMGQSSLMLGFEYPTVLYVGLAAILLGYLREGETQS